MTTLHTIVLVIHVLIGAMIVGLVLVQRGKGADAGAGFGAGASGTVFGARGSANFLSRSTGVLALFFFCTSLGLAYLGTQREAPKSLLDTAVPVETPVQIPGQPPVETAPVVGPTNKPASAELPALPTVPGQPAQPVGQPAAQPGG